MRLPRRISFCVALALAPVVACCAANQGGDEIAGGPIVVSGGHSGAGKGGTSVVDAGSLHSGGGSGGSGSSGATGTSAKEICGDGLDNDGNAQVDDECTCQSGASQQCFLGDPALAGVGPCVWGTQTCVATGQGEIQSFAWGPCTGSGAPSAEICDGADNDCNGVVDDSCQCVDGTSQACASTCGQGKEICENGVWTGCTAPPPNAQGGCDIVLDIDVDGDCVCAPACPPQAPYPIGCNIKFQGNDPRGCVATAKNGVMYFQEGDKCNAGHLSGTVTCSSIAGPGLNASNCPINKNNPIYGSKPSNCPNIISGSPQSCYY